MKYNLWMAKVECYPGLYEEGKGEISMSVVTHPGTCDHYSFQYYTIHYGFKCGDWFQARTSLVKD